MPDKTLALPDILLKLSHLRKFDSSEHSAYEMHLAIAAEHDPDSLSHDHKLSLVRKSYIARLLAFYPYQDEAAQHAAQWTIQRLEH